MAKRWPFRVPVPTGSIVGMQMMGHMVLSRGLWRSAGTAANAARLLPAAPVLSAAAALPAFIDDVLFYTMLGMSIHLSYLPRGQPVPLAARWHWHWHLVAIASTRYRADVVAVTRPAQRHSNSCGWW